MTEQEKKELLKDVRIYMTDPKNSKKWKMAPYFSSVVLNFLNNYADKFDDPERVMNVVKRLKVVPFREGDEFKKNDGEFLNDTIVYSNVSQEFKNRKDAIRLVNEKLPKIIAFNQYSSDRLNFKFNESDEVKSETQKEDTTSSKENPELSETKKSKPIIKNEALAQLFKSLEEVDYNNWEQSDHGDLMENYKLYTHELAHAFALFETIPQDSQKSNIDWNSSTKYMGGVDIFEFNFIHEGMTEWIALKNIGKLTDDEQLKIVNYYRKDGDKIGFENEKFFICGDDNYIPFVWYANVIHTLFPEGFYDIYFNGRKNVDKYSDDYPHLKLEDLTDYYGRNIQKFQKEVKDDEKDEQKVKQYLNEIKDDFIDLKQQLALYVETGIVPLEKYKNVSACLDNCYSDLCFYKNIESKEDEILQEEELRGELDISKEENKEDDNHLKCLVVGEKENYYDEIEVVKYSDLPRSWNLKIADDFLTEESLETKIWVLKNGTVGLGEDAIKAFRQNKYDITDAVMIDCKYGKAPIIVKQDNKNSVKRYESAEDYIYHFIRPDYKTNYKLSKEQSYAALSIAKAMQPDGKNYGIYAYKNLEFDKNVLDSLHENSPKTILYGIGTSEMIKKQEKKEKPFGEE